MRRAWSRTARAAGSIGVAALVFSVGAPLTAQGADPQLYDVDGLQVGQIVLPNDDLVAVQLYLLGGSRELMPATAGIERLLLSVSERGTVGYAGDSLRNEEVRTGSRFFSGATADWSVIGFTGLREEFDHSWELLSERVVRPSIDSAALEVTRNQFLTAVRADHDDPDASARALAERLAYEGHPYAVDVDGTEESLTSLTAEDLRAYHDQRFIRSRMLLVVTGGVDRPAVEAAVRRTLGTLPLGSYTWTPPPPWSRDEARVVVEQRRLPTNYIVGYFGGPTTRDDDYPAFQVAVSALSSYVSNEIRDRGLSYAAGATVVDRAAQGGAVYVSTVNPNQSLDIINQAIELFGQGSIPRWILRDYAESSSLEFYLSNQTTTQQADFLATSLLLTGKPRTVTSWVKDLRGVAGSDVRRMFRKYIKNIQYGFLGIDIAVPRDKMLKY